MQHHAGVSCAPHGSAGVPALRPAGGFPPAITVPVTSLPGVRQHRGKVLRDDHKRREKDSEEEKLIRGKVTPAPARAQHGR